MPDGGDHAKKTNHGAVGTPRKPDLTLAAQMTSPRDAKNPDDAPIQVSELQKAEESSTDRFAQKKRNVLLLERILENLDNPEL